LTVAVISAFTGIVLLIFGSGGKSGIVENIRIGVESRTDFCGVSIIQYYAVEIVIGVFSDNKKLGNSFSAFVFYCVADIVPRCIACDYRNLTAVIL